MVDVLRGGQLGTLTNVTLDDGSVVEAFVPYVNNGGGGGGSSNVAITAPFGRKADAASVSTAMSTEDVALFTALATAARQDTGNTALTTINTTLGSPFQAGGSVGISGTLPAFAATPTVNLGTVGGIATEATLAAQSAKLPASLGAKSGATSLSVVPNTDTAFPVTGTFFQATQPVSLATLPALVAGSAIIGKVGIDQTTDGTTNLVAAKQSGTWNIGSITTLPALVAGSAVVGKFGIDQTTPGTTNLVAAGQNGTWTMQPGNTANTTAWKVDGSAVTQPVSLGGTLGPFPAPATPWTYAAAASGIANTTTAVTFKTSAGGSLKNYVSSMQIMWEALTTATELAIRDGAGGTVLWRMKIPATLAGTRDIVFPVPLVGTAATLMEVVTLTASGAGAVYFDAQGYAAL